MHTQFDLADPHAVPPLQPAQAAAAGTRRRRQHRFGLVSRDRHAHPHLAWTEVADHRHRAADVIRIAVGDGHVIHPPQTACAQRRPEDSVADVEVPARRDTAGIHEQRLAVRTA